MGGKQSEQEKPKEKGTESSNEELMKNVIKLLEQNNQKNVNNYINKNYFVVINQCTP